jgi:hypothetical protein
MGKGKDRGARGPIKPITPTFILPRQGEGVGEPVAFLISRPLAQPQPQFSKEVTKESVFFNFVGFVSFVVHSLNRS